ncbi:MAG: hypothetical protein QOF48_1206 [Verrucomicrobiota bacterium]|jgi:formylglycine-generating enzyme required for sulfatase activity/mono/diheme cytochrome c family protein
MNMNPHFRAVLAVTALGTALSFAAQAADKIDFAREIQPLLESTCLSCHKEGKQEGGLLLHTRSQAAKGGDSKGPGLVAGKPADSALYKVTILPKTHDDVMPPKGDVLTKPQTEALRLWIEQGAEWPATVALKQRPRIKFSEDIQPLLELNCVACHRDGFSRGGLRLDEKELAFKGGDTGPGLVPFRPRESLVYKNTTLAVDDEALMPPAKKGGPLPKEKIELLSSWIEQGCSWPDGVKLSPKKADEVAGADEGGTVLAIHKKIMANLREKTQAEMKGYTNSIPGTPVTYGMVPIPAGEFVLGSPPSEKGRKADEGPQVKLKIPAFWMGTCEVTWNEYDLFMYTDQEKAMTLETNNPYLDKVSDAVSRPTKPYAEMSFNMGKGEHPAISMTQHSANKYCEWLSAKTGHFYRLPTEAEWEYACRAGTTTAYFFGDDPAEMSKYAWFGKNSEFQYQKAGRKLPNPWGLHDMYGNVTEWCLDQYKPGSYAKFPGGAVNPWVPSTTSYPHVVRGGHWDDDDMAMLRSAARRHSDPSWKQQDPQLPKSIWYHTDAQWLGFRIVRPLEVPSAAEMQKLWNNGVEDEGKN